MTPASQIASPGLMPVGDLHPWDEDPRTISPARFENLRRAMAADPEFPLLRPILARTDGTIYCVNQRYLAAVTNGLAAVPAIPEDVDERTMRERAIRDNEQWGEWSDGSALVLRSLEGAGSDLSLLGLTPPETATTQAGQRYEFGPHRLICGDARDPEVGSRLLGEERADRLWTDPPYGVDLHVSGHSGDFAERLRERRKGPPRPSDKPYSFRTLRPAELREGDS